MFKVFTFVNIMIIDLHFNKTLFNVFKDLKIIYLKLNFEIVVNSSNIKFNLTNIYR